MKHPKHFSAWTVTTSSIALLLGGCAVGPDYQQPDIMPPASFHGGDSASNAAGDASFADLKWQEVFKDPQMSAYIKEALEANWDVKIAASRLLEAEAALGVERSRFFPSIFGGGDLYNTRTSENGPTGGAPNPERSYGDAGVGISSYEVDLWGNIRYANTAARARYLQSQEAQHTVRQTLIAQVAASYLNLLELDYELEIAEDSLETRQDSLILTTAREQGGVAAMQDVVQAEILVYTAQSRMVDIKRDRDLQENALCILLGRNPTTLERGAQFSEQGFDDAVPAGLPSSLVERRPDIRSAEQGLIEANANIGQAKAAFYPQVSLTGSYGYQSLSSSELFKSASRDWQFGPSVTLPIFTGGRLESNLKVTQAQYETALLSYQQTVQNAFKEVSDALVNYQRTREFTDRQELLTKSNREAAELANIRYEGGVTSYLEVLYNEQELFDAELNLAKSELSELLAVVQLYRSLGGGWKAPAQ